jgi:hypothetical protein
MGIPKRSDVVLPLTLLVLVILAFAIWIWRERRHKQRQAGKDGTTHDPSESAGSRGSTDDGKKRKASPDTLRDMREAHEDRRYERLRSTRRRRWKGVPLKHFRDVRPFSEDDASDRIRRRAEAYVPSRGLTLVKEREKEEAAALRAAEEERLRNQRFVSRRVLARQAGTRQQTRAQTAAAAAAATDNGDAKRSSVITGTTPAVASSSSSSLQHILLPVHHFDSSQVARRARLQELAASDLESVASVV